MSFKDVYVPVLVRIQSKCFAHSGRNARYLLSTCHAADASASAKQETRAPQCIKECVFFQESSVIKCKARVRQYKIYFFHRIKY